MSRNLSSKFVTRAVAPLLQTFQSPFLPTVPLKAPYSLPPSRQFRTSRPLCSRDNFSKNRNETQKHVAQQQRHTDDAQPKTRSGIRYADSPEPVHGTTPHSTLNSTQPERVVFNSTAEAQAASLEEQAALGVKVEPKRPKTDAEDLLVTLNRVRVHPIYKLTRVFVVGSSFVMLSHRVRAADSLSEEQWDEATPIMDRIPKIAAKTQRVVFFTLQRVWSPWESYQEEKRAREQQQTEQDEEFPHDPAQADADRPISSSIQLDESDSETTQGDAVNSYEAHAAAV